MNKKIIIIGAGAAGLMAAVELSKSAQVTVLERAADAGGRIRSMQLSDGEGVIETGAEFVHGKLPITDKLMRNAGLTKVEVSGKMVRKEGTAFIEQEEMIEGWDELLKMMKDAPDDMTMQELIMLKLPGQEHQALREHIKSYVEGFDLASVSEVSVKSLYDEWSNEGEQFRIREGYAQLIDYLRKQATGAGVRFCFNETVNSVKWRKGEVTAYTTSGNQYNAQQLLVTLPVALMQTIAIHFDPAPVEHLEAYKEIGFGPVIKVVFDFHEPFWEKDLSFIFTSEIFPTWWTQFPLRNNLLTGWCGGPPALSLSDLSDHDLLEVALDSLSRIFGLRKDAIDTNLRHKVVFNWNKSENGGGGYSFAKPASAAARKLLISPVASTIFFAGEGLIGGAYPGTVEAALQSGKDAAGRMLKT